MATDIVERLNRASGAATLGRLCGEAASEIERLRQELAEARERETLHRSDATCAWKEAEALRHELGLAREDLAAFRSERSYVIGCNTGWEEAIEQSAQVVEGFQVPKHHNDGELKPRRYPSQTSVSIAAAIRALAAGKEGVQR